MLNLTRYVSRRYPGASCRRAPRPPTMFAQRALRPLSRARAFHFSAQRCALTPQIPLGRPLTSTDYTVQLLTAANSGRFADCLQLAERMKKDGIKPDYTVYSVLMSFAARERSWLFAWAIFDDMVLAGVQPTAATFVHLIAVSMLQLRQSLIIDSILQGTS